MLGPVPPGEARLDGLGAARAVPAHARLHLALRRPGRPAALVRVADEDDDVLRRPLRRPRPGDGQGSGLAPARWPAPRVLAGAPRGDPPPERVGADVRPA